MNDPLEWIGEEARIRLEKGLNRSLVVRPPDLISFSSNDYLGLANDPRVIAAAAESASRFGFGAGASPLVSGWTAAHRDLADALAEFERVEAVALFASGFAANLGTIAALVGKGDAAYLDRLDHACLIDGARLSGASLRVYPHNDPGRLEAILRRDRGRFRRSLIATDGVFSMDGDLAPLADLADLADRFGAILMVDEAHGTGVFGATGRGAAEELGVADRVAVKVGTLSKALGSLGGFVAGSRRLIDHLINSSRSLIYSTSLPPPAASAALEALRIARSEPWRREAARSLGESLRSALRDANLAVIPSTGPIVPVLVGDPSRAMNASARLGERGYGVPAIRPPTVPPGTSRLRISVTAGHSAQQVAGLADAIREHLAEDRG